MMGALSVRPAKCVVGSQSAQMTSGNPHSAATTPTLPTRDVVAHPQALDALVSRIQEYTKKWPEPLRYSQNVHIGATDTDQGFERILRETLEGALPVGHVSGLRDLGIGDGRASAIVGQHELDLILQCDEGRFVIEAKAWQGEVGKEAVTIFIAKILDFMAALNFDPLGPVFAGFIGLAGFSEAALRVMFAFGVTPFTRCSSQLSFRYVDAILLGTLRESQKRGWSAWVDTLTEHRAALTPFLAQEGKSMSQTCHFDVDSAVIDLDGIRRASEMFDEGRIAHQQALTCYREVRKAIQVDRV